MNGHDDYIDKTIECESREEREEFEEAKRADEEDNGYDKPSLSRAKTFINGVEATPEKEMGQYSNDLSSAVKVAYKHLYNLGLNTEQVRQKLDYLARFMGELSLSRLSVEQLKFINMWFDDLEKLQFKFNK